LPSSGKFAQLNFVLSSFDQLKQYKWTSRNFGQGRFLAEKIGVSQHFKLSNLQIILCFYFDYKPNITFSVKLQIYPLAATV